MGINRDQKIVACFQQAAELNELHLLYEPAVGVVWGWGWSPGAPGLEWPVGVSAASFAENAPGA